MKQVSQKIAAQEQRPGFLSECKELCEGFGLEFSRVAPKNPEQQLRDFGDELKAEIYCQSFQKDLAAVRLSRQATILASLFPPDASYYSYRPLDLAVRVLDGQNRLVRTSFLQNLSGTSYLVNCIHKNCHFCNLPISDISHYLLDCQTISNERKSLLHTISSYLAKIHPKLSKIWEASIKEGQRQNLCAILFGGNYVIEKNGDWKIFRKTHYRQPHQTDKTCILVGKFLEELKLKCDQRSGG